MTAHTGRAPGMSERYVHHYLVSILPLAMQSCSLLSTIPQPEMSAPPFAVSAGEVEALCHKRAGIRLLVQNPRIQERGLSLLQENIFRLTLNW